MFVKNKHDPAVVNCAFLFQCACGWIGFAGFKVNFANVPRKMMEPVRNSEGDNKQVMIHFSSGQITFFSLF